MNTAINSADLQSGSLPKAGRASHLPVFDIDSIGLDMSLVMLLRCLFVEVMSHLLAIAFDDERDRCHGQTALDERQDDADHQ